MNGRRLAAVDIWGALEAEVSDVDASAGLRRYTACQMWVIPPFSFVVVEARYRHHVG